MRGRLDETDLRDGLSWLRAVLTGDDDGARCVATHADPGRVLDAVATLCIPGRIDRDDPVGWIDRMFADLDRILAGSAARRAKADQDDEPP